MWRETIVFSLREEEWYYKFMFLIFHHIPICGEGVFFCSSRDSLSSREISIVKVLSSLKKLSQFIANLYRLRINWSENRWKAHSLDLRATPILSRGMQSPFGCSTKIEKKKKLEKGFHPRPASWGSSIRVKEERTHPYYLILVEAIGIWQSIALRAWDVNFLISSCNVMAAWRGKLKKWSPFIFVSFIFFDSRLKFWSLTPFLKIRRPWLVLVSLFLHDKSYL